MAVGRSLTALYAVFAGLLVAGAVPPLASADHDSLKVIVLIEDREFTDKGVANFSIHVFNKGVPIDPDGPPYVEVGYGPPHNVSLTRIATGVYNGTVDMATEGVPFGDVHIKANATLGKTGPDDTIFNQAEGFGMIVMRSNATTGFRIHNYLKAIADDHIKPGTQVTFGVRATYDGKPVDPGGQSYSIEYLRSDISGPDSHMHVQASKLSVGDYEYNYTVPDVAVSGTAIFFADCSYSGQEQYDFYYLPVDFFSVVIHNTTRTANETGFDLYIGDQSGAPVAGATIELEYMVDYNRSDDQPPIRGRTNSTGVASMTIAHPKDAGGIYLYGYANASGKSQSFSHDIDLSTGYRHKRNSGPMFDVDVTGGFNAPPPGQVMYRDCYAYNNSKVWANQTVYCFVLTGLFEPNGRLRQDTHVEEYTCTTDENGKMTLPVTVPAWTNWQLDFEFQSATGVHPGPGENGSDHVSLDGLNYSSTSTSMGFDAPSLAWCGTLDMHRGALSLGVPVSVWGNVSARDFPVGEIGWDFGISPEMADWQVLVQLWHYMPSGGAQYRGTVVLPSFLPAGLNYTIYGYAENDLFGWRYDVASPLSTPAVTPPVSPPGKKPGFSTTLADNLCFAIGAAILFLALGTVFVLWRASRRSLPPGDPPQGPASP